MQVVSVVSALHTVSEEQGLLRFIEVFKPPPDSADYRTQPLLCVHTSSYHIVGRML